MEYNPRIKDYSFAKF